MSQLKLLQRQVRLARNFKKAQFLLRFFKTGPGEYAEGDIFYGLTVPQSRHIAAAYRDLLSLADTFRLLNSPVHEERLIALLILVERFTREPASRHPIYRGYMARARRVNNWDLVDTSAPAIVGGYLLNRPRGALKRLAASDNLWERRIAIVSTFRFIKAGDFSDTLAITRLLMRDEHDLIHKACGWMLRELGKRSRPTLEKFLQKYCTRMPRTMLRYAIEHFSPARRRRYLKGRI